MTLPNFTDPAQAADASLYKTAIDGTAAIHDQTAGAFYVHEADTPDMTVVLDGGSLQNNDVISVSSQQTTGTIVAPTTNKRIDTIAVNSSGGFVVTTGTEGIVPSAPKPPTGYIVIVHVLLQTTTTAITNSMITDRRPFNYTNERQVILDVPVVLLSTDTPATSATAIGHTVLDSARAKKAIIQIRVTLFSITADASLGFYAKNDNSISSAEAYQKGATEGRVGDAVSDTNQFTVNLDANYDFWYLTFASGTATTRIRAYLVGYYV